jgi:OmpA-OmpF porin, OOP family
MRVPMIITVAVSAALGLTGCGVREVVVPSQSAAPVTGVAPSPAASSAASPVPSAPDAATFPEFPPITIPDVTALTASSATFTKALGDLATPVSGISVAGARCDTSGKVVNRGSLTEVAGGDGSGAWSDGSLQVTNNGDGSGTYSDGALQITVNGDGSGTYSNGSLQIVMNGDGSGTYGDGALQIAVSGNGSGTYSNGAIQIVNNGNGSGTYRDGSLSVTNNGNGSGTYSDGATSVVNNGDGTGMVNGESRAVTALAPLAPIGRFPSAGALAPVGRSCGTLLRLSDRVLFDFARSDIRPEASPALDALARALDGETSPVAVNGHTDSKGSDADNQALSQRRADAVVAELRRRGVEAPLAAAAFGESQPIAPNERGGKDDPAGRALNRRVEIVVPGS